VRGFVPIVGVALVIATVPVVSEAAGPPRPPGPPVAARTLSLRVDCARGQTVTDALAAGAAHVGPLAIEVQGVCAEAVLITRDDVALTGAASGDGFQTPAGQNGVTVRGARRVTLTQLTIDAAASVGNFGLWVWGSSECQGRGLEIRNAAFGLFLEAGSALRLEDTRVLDQAAGSEIRGFLNTTRTEFRRSGASAVNVNFMGAWESTSDVIDTSHWGATVKGGAVAQIDRAQITDAAQQGLRVLDNAAVLMVRSRIAGCGVRGVDVESSSILTLARGNVVEGNGATGVRVRQGALLRMSDGPEPTVIRGHTGDGISLSDTSIIDASTFQSTGNGGYGLRCTGVPSAAQISGTFSSTTVFGNGAGQINGCPGLALP
jgi:hypothetical protein